MQEMSDSITQPSSPAAPSTLCETRPLNLLKHTLLELPLNLLALVVRTRLAVESHEGTKVELGCLQQLDLTDVDLVLSVLAHVKLFDSCYSRSGEGRYPGWPSQSHGQ